MSLTGKLTQVYFNFAYNHVYDFTTARLSRYHKLQQTCIRKLEVKDNDKVLCVGLGTGNEIFHILQMSRNVNIVGVDYSNTALRKAYKKALRLGKEIEVFNMDAQHLEFPAESFDKVACFHVMDFIENNSKATKEILRVLKNGGRFVITYPSGREDIKFGLNLLKESIDHSVDSGKHWSRAFFESVAQAVVGLIYLPLLLRPNRGPYSRMELEAAIAGLASGPFQIEEDSVYRDFIVYGLK